MPCSLTPQQPALLSAAATGTRLLATAKTGQQHVLAMPKHGQQRCLPSRAPTNQLPAAAAALQGQLPAATALPEGPKIKRTVPSARAHVPTGPARSRRILYSETAVPGAPKPLLLPRTLHPCSATQAHRCTPPPCKLRLSRTLHSQAPWLATTLQAGAQAVESRLRWQPTNHRHHPNIIVTAAAEAEAEPLKKPTATTQTAAGWHPAACWLPPQVTTLLPAA